MAQATATAPTLGLGIVGLIVRDLGRSLEFYRRLGLNVPPDAAQGTNFRLRMDNGQVFFWDTYEVVRDFDPDWQPSSGDLRVILEFGFAHAEQVDAKHNELVEAGASSYLAPRSLGQTRYALVEDPDGNQIGLRFPLAS